MRLLNQYEEITFDQLNRIAAENGARVFPKVRVADVLPISRSGLSGDLFGYALKAHFDFVVTDGDYQPQFAVEFDGQLHKTSALQRQRDGMKHLIIEHFGFPLLRVNSRYVNRMYRGMDLLGYFAESWFLSQAFDEAQAQGIVPYDESFDMTLIISNGSSRTRFPYWLSLDVQLEIQRLYDAGEVVDRLPSHWIGVDIDGNSHCLAWLRVSQHGAIVATTGMRRQFFPADVTDVLSQVAVFDIRRGIDSFTNHAPHQVSMREVKRLLTEYKNKYRMCSFLGHYRYS